jgi:hypothetical protein
MNGNSQLPVHGPQQNFKGKEPKDWLPTVNRRLLTLLGFILFLTLAHPAFSDPRGQVSLGASLDGWSSNTSLPFNGTEFFLPFTFSYGVDPNWWLSGQTFFAVGNYTDSIAGTRTQNLTNLTASTLTSDYYFKNFDVPNMVEISLTLPTGDPSWETKQVASNIPTIFVNSRYQDEGWGVSGLYGLSFSAGASVEYGVSVGYTYAGPYDPYYGGLPGNTLKIGDSLFAAFNRAETLPDSQSSVFRLCVMASMPTDVNGQTNFQMGPNGSASYSFNNPAGFSWGLGAQIYTLANRYYVNTGGAVVYGQEPYGSSGERFNFTPSLALGNLTLGGLLQYVQADGYPITDASGLYDGGGFVFGFTPTYNLTLDTDSALNLNAGYDFIVAHNASTGFTQDVDYQYWAFGATYALKIY